MKNYSNAIIFGLAIIISSIFLGNAYVQRNQQQGQIQVTGLAEEDFVSDLIVWEGRFEVFSVNLKEAFQQLEKDKIIIKEYLVSKGVDPSQIVFTAINTGERNKRKYNEKGGYIGDEFLGYELNQSVEIESKEVEKIETISREITELINQGLNFYSADPRYFYTQLADLKIEMISKATEDARLRAEKIAEFSGGKLGELQSARMGIFQITAQNSAEDYSWGGTFNTTSKNKTASITMKLEYSVK